MLKVHLFWNQFSLAQIRLCLKPEQSLFNFYFDPRYLATKGLVKKGPKVNYFNRPLFYPIPNGELIEEDIEDDVIDKVDPWDA